MTQTHTYIMIIIIVIIVIIMIIIIYKVFKSNIKEIGFRSLQSGAGPDVKRGLFQKGFEIFRSSNSVYIGLHRHMYTHIFYIHNLY